MGVYVNPRGETKENFLISNGIMVDYSFKWVDVPEGCLPVVLIDNGMFTAAVIAYSSCEFDQCVSDITQVHTIYIVAIKDLLLVSKLADYI